jgi:putative heme-binding domain-containing protein
VLLIASGSLNPALAQRAPFAIPDPDPEIERRSFIVADGFEANLYAADPIIAKPIQMNFDPAGRLWIVSSEVYPQIEPGQRANDKVLVLEDADGDGRAEKTAVFAEGLLIPTGVEPGDGGAYVANSTELLHLRDTDGDGKADRTRVVLSGFGTEDTHHILHTLRWGQDGMLYFNQSIYIHSHVETPHGVRRLGGGGIWQFRPETMELNVFIRGLVNPWGHHVDRWGQSFATDGAGGEGINYALPGAYYVTAPDAVRILHGLNPGSPKYCGLEVVSGRHLPDSWQGNLLTNDFRGNRVCRFVVGDDGAGFSAREQSELIKTPHVAFRPIDVKMGPDGAIYIADWYNPIIQHGEVDFRDPRRDHTRGRIWRVTAKGRPLVPRPRLVDAPLADLLEDLKAPEDWTRHHAKRVLKGRGAKRVVPALAAWVRGLDRKDPEYEHRRLEALWTYQALDMVEPELLAQLLESPDARVRAAATRIVPFWQHRLKDPRSLLARGVEDDNPRVRLEAVRSLSQIPGLESAEIALRALDRPVDTFLEYALWLTARRLSDRWLPEVRAGRFDFQGNPRRLVFALRAIGSPEVLKPLLAMVRAGRVPADQDESVQGLIATLGGPEDLAMVLDLAERSTALSPARKSALLEAMVRATRQRKVVPAGDLTRLDAMLTAPDAPLRADAARAVGAWKVERLWIRLVDLARGKDTPSAVRAAALEGLVAFEDAASRRVVEDVADHGPGPEARMLAIVALNSTEGAAVERAAHWLSSLSPEQTTLADTLVARVMERRGAPEALAKALAATTVDADVARSGIRAVRASGRASGALVDAFAKAGNLASATRTFSKDEMSRFLAEVAQAGNADRGEALFRRKDLTCLKCHAISGAGGQVGPGLESIGASAPVDYLVDSLLEPGKAVKENYHATVAALDDGRIVTGIRVRQTDTELVLRDADDREQAIPLGSIEEQKPGGSLMPTGLTDSLTRAELGDLVRFLSELGKIGPYAASKERIFRRWRALEPSAASSTALIRTSLDAVVQRESASLAWNPLYTRVSGELPVGEIPAISRGSFAPPICLVRTELEVTVPGAVRLLLDGAKPLALWLDGRRIEPDALTVELASGPHALTLAVDPAAGRQAIRARLDDVPGSPARAHVVLGK